MMTLTAQRREAGKAKRERAMSLVPGVLYGRKEASVPVALPLRDFQKALEEAGESTVITLQGLGAPKQVLIHDIAYDAVTDIPMHVDFYAIEKGQKVTVSIPLEFEGVSPAVKDLGGTLIKVMRELEIEADPNNLPHAIMVNIEPLAALESRLTVADLNLPSGATTEADPEEVVALVSMAEEEPAEEAPMDITQIGSSVERGKKEEEVGAAE